MTCHGSLADLARQLNVPLTDTLTAKKFSGICTDTRQLCPGNVFVALSGEQFDGHDYVEQALQSGAIAAVVSREIQACAGIQLAVQDTLLAYQAIARWWRAQFSIPVIAITGSAGKTSTKEMLAAALERYGTVLKTERNYNNDIGVPLTLLQMNRFHDFAVIEMAMRGPGEIARLGRTAAPTHGIILNVGSAHIGRLGSRQAIAQAKCELLEQLDRETGVAILNGEDELLLETAATVWSGTVLPFGFDLPEAVQVKKNSAWQASPPTILRGNRSLPIPLPGRHQGLNYAAVLELIDNLDLDLSALESGIVLSADGQGRNQRHIMPDRVEILDETYNAAPEAVIAALQVLCASGNNRYWAVLGPMRELGSAADGLYAEVGQMAATLADRGLRLCLFDPKGEMHALAEQVQAERIHCFSQRSELARWLCSAVEPGDRLLFKGARSTEMERVMQQFIQFRYPSGVADSATSHPEN